MKTAITILCAISVLLNTYLVVHGLLIMSGNSDGLFIWGVAQFIVGILYYNRPFQAVYRLNQDREYYG